MYMKFATVKSSINTAPASTCHIGCTTNSYINVHVVLFVVEFVEAKAKTVTYLLSY